jgi:hypothetical protein
MSTEREDVDKFRESVLADISKLRRLELSMLEAEVMRSLMGGKKTGVELVDYIFGLGRGDDGFNAARLRVRRATRGLERRGFIATRIFGRDRPYHITRHGIAVLVSIAPETEKPRIMKPGEIAILTITALLGVGAFLYPGSVLNPSWKVGFPLFAGFFTLLGISITICYNIARRVV